MQRILRTLAHLGIVFPNLRFFQSEGNTGNRLAGVAQLCTRPRGHNVYFSSCFLTRARSQIDFRFQSTPWHWEHMKQPFLATTATTMKKQSERMAVDGSSSSVDGLPSLR